MADSIEHTMGINLIETSKGSERLYAALSFKGGSASSLFAISDPSKSANDGWDEGTEHVEAFQANRAFWNVFKRYLLDSGTDVEDVFLDPSATMVAWDSADDASLVATVREILSMRPTEEGFANAKRQAFEEYADRFKDPLFRFMYKMQEQTEANKGFLYSSFLDDFEGMDFEAFEASWNHLLVPENALLCVMGDDILRIEEKVMGMDVAKGTMDVMPMRSLNDVPLERSVSIVLEGTTMFELGALSFGDLEGMTMMEKLFCLEVANANLFDGTGSVSLDDSDSSILFTDRTAEDLLAVDVWAMDAERYRHCVDSYVLELRRVLDRFPYLYVAEQARNVSFGTDPTMLMSIADRIPFDAFSERLERLIEEARQITIVQSPYVQGPMPWGDEGLDAADGSDMAE